MFFNTAPPFLILPRNPDTQQIFPLYRRLGLCHIFQAVNIFGSRPEEPELALTCVHPLQFSSYHCRTFMGPSLQRSTWPSNFSVFANRYVDNRYIFFPEEKVQEPSIQVSFCEDFHQHPVKLEQVTCNELLGFLVNFFTFERWPINSHSLDHLVSLHRLDEVHQECPTQHFRFRFVGEIQTPNRNPPLYRRLCFTAFFKQSTGSGHQQWTVGFSCWFFTFERWPINSHSLDHLVSLHRLDEVHQECPTQHFRFWFVGEIQTPNTNSPLYRRLCFTTFFKQSTGTGHQQWTVGFSCWQTFERWPINSDSLNHLVFLHRLDEVHHECPTQHFSFWFFTTKFSSTGWMKSTKSVQRSFRFRFFREIQATSPLYRF